VLGSKHGSLRSKHENPDLLTHYEFARTSPNASALHSSVITDTHNLDCFDMEQRESRSTVPTASAFTESTERSFSDFGLTKETKRQRISASLSESRRASIAGVALFPKSRSMPTENEQLPRDAERKPPTPTLRTVLRHAFDNPDEYGSYTKPVSTSTTTKSSSDVGTTQFCTRNSAQVLGRSVCVCGVKSFLLLDTQAI
jgi:hypothetical protein